MKASRKGISMIEILIAMSLFGAAMGSVMMSLDRGAGAFRRSSTNASVDSKVARTIDRIARELATASSGTLIPADPDGGDTLTFEPTIGFEGAPILGDPIRLTLELSPGELDNGLDDDGNGLIDERNLVRIQNPGNADEQRTVLARGVRALLEGEEDNGLDDNDNGLADEAGFAVDMDGDILILRLSLEIVDPAGGDTISRTLETSLTLRN